MSGRGYFAVVEVDELGQVIDFTNPIWGIGTTEAAALKDADRWQSEVVQAKKPILRAFPCTRRLYKDAQTWGGGGVTYYAPGSGHKLDLVGK